MLLSFPIIGIDCFAYEEAYTSVRTRRINKMVAWSPHHFWHLWVPPGPLDCQSTMCVWGGCLEECAHDSVAALVDVVLCYIERLRCAMHHSPYLDLCVGRSAIPTGGDPALCAAAYAMSSSRACNSLLVFFAPVLSVRRPLTTVFVFVFVFVIRPICT